MGEVCPPNTAGRRSDLFALNKSPFLRTLARREVLVGFVLVALTLAALGGVTSSQFVNLDDPDYVMLNGNVSTGLLPDNILWSLTAFHAGNWHPLTWMSLQLDMEIGDGTAAPYHRTNLILHVLNVLLLYGLLLRMSDSWPRAALVAALFGVHPLHVESVAWIAERKDVLSTFFGLLAVAAYLGYLRRPSLLRYLVLLLAYAASLASKPMLVTLPFLLLLLDWWPLRRLHAGQQPAGAEPHPPFPAASVRRLLIEKVPLLLLALASCAMTVVAQHRGGAVGSMAMYSGPLRLANAVDSTAAYLVQTVWPTGMAAYYPFPRSGLPAWRVTLAGSLLVAVTALALWRARSRPYLFAGWFWFLGTLVPVIGLVQVGAQARADRYTYVPLIGIFVAAVWGLAESLPRRWQTWGVVAAAALVLPPCIWLTRIQVEYWNNSIALWEHTLSLTDDNVMAELNYAQALFEVHRLDEAVRQLEEVLRLHPRAVDAMEMLAIIHDVSGRKEKALTYYRAASALRPDELFYRFKIEKLTEDTRPEAPP